MKALNYAELQTLAGGGRWTHAGLSCFLAGLGTAAVIGSGPFAPGTAMLVGWGLGTAIGTCAGMIYRASSSGSTA